MIEPDWFFRIKYMRDHEIVEIFDKEGSHSTVRRWIKIQSAIDGRRYLTRKRDGYSLIAVNDWNASKGAERGIAAAMKAKAAEEASNAMKQAMPDYERQRQDRY